jgi:membrane protease YdiL (CAAX protease family)
VEIPSISDSIKEPEDRTYAFKTWLQRYQKAIIRRLTAFAVIATMFQICPLVDPTRSLAITIVGLVLFYVFLAWAIWITWPAYAGLGIKSASSVHVVGALICALVVFVMSVQPGHGHNTHISQGFRTVGREVSSIAIHPPLEEALFRGLLIGPLITLFTVKAWNRWGKLLARVGAIAVSGVLFASLHFDKDHFFFWIKVVSGSTYGALFVMSDSLIPPTLCHALLNLLYWLY